jgi:hypothetical protein
MERHAASVRDGNTPLTAEASRIVWDYTAMNTMVLESVEHIVCIALRLISNECTGRQGLLELLHRLHRLAAGMDKTRDHTSHQPCGNVR